MASIGYIMQQTAEAVTALLGASDTESRRKAALACVAKLSLSGERNDDWTKLVAELKELLRTPNDIEAFTKAGRLATFLFARSAAVSVYGAPLADVMDSVRARARGELDEV
jgi:hypothetical protein